MNNLTELLTTLLLTLVMEDVTLSYMLDIYAKMQAQVEIVREAHIIRYAPLQKDAHL